MYQENVVLCGASAYEQKYYFNQDFDSLPESIKQELHIMCVLYTEDIGGILTLEFDDNGSLQFKTEALDSDAMYDDIGSVLKIKQLQTEKRELLSVLLKKEFVSAIYLDFAAYGRTHFMDELAEDVAKIKKAKKQAFFAMPRIFRNEIADWFVSLANDLQNLQLDGILVRGYEELAYCRQ